VALGAGVVVIELSQQYLQDVFFYDPSGVLCRKRMRGRQVLVPWKMASHGYLIARLEGRQRYLHRMVWMFHHGSIPPYIDHIDGDKGNNKIENLRAANQSQNGFNSGARKNNTSGAKGVTCIGAHRRRPWAARISVRGKCVHLGCFASVAEAAEAYLSAAKQHAGDFARPAIRGAT
jgi:hypothetical protein